MARKSNKDYRLEEFKDSRLRSKHPCMRCLNRFCEGSLEANGHLGCNFPEIAPGKGDLMSWIEFALRDDQGNKVQTFRCEHCHSLGQSCWAPPAGFETEYAKLEEHFVQVALANDDSPESKAPNAEQVTDHVQQIRNRHTVKEYAIRLYNAVTAVASPFGIHLTAHNGAIDADANPRSGVVLQHRDRSAAGIAKKLASQKRKMDKAAEETDDEEETVITPKKKKGRFGMIGLNSTSSPTGTDDLALLEEQDRIRRLESHKQVVAGYESLDSAAKTRFRNKHGGKKPVEGGWMKKKAFIALEE